MTVSQPWAEKLRVLHRGKATYTITNGFDPDEVSKEQIDLTSKFTITYTGIILIGKHEHSKLFAALQDLILDGTMDPNEIEVRFYGPENELLASGIEEYGLSAIAKHYGMVPIEISFEKQRESQLLLLLNWEDQKEKGVYPLKIFEYLAAQRPILATGGFGNDVIERLLNETKTGIYAKKVEDIKGILIELYAEYKHNGEITYNGNVKKLINTAIERWQENSWRFWIMKMTHMVKNLDGRGFFSLFIVLLISTDLAILLNIPFLRQIIGFIFLILLPGLLILQILKLAERYKDIRGFKTMEEIS